MSGFSLVANTASGNSVGFFYGGDLVAWYGFQDLVGDGAGWTVSGPSGLIGPIIQVVAYVDPQYGYDRTWMFIYIDTPTTLAYGVSYTFIPPHVACFAKGTRLLTSGGYKPVEELCETTDKIVTSDGRTIGFTLLATAIARASRTTAPYLVQPHAFGHNNPMFPLRVSPMHKIQLRKGLWTSPEVAAQTNPRVKQYGIGEPVAYYHLECANFLKDNLVAEGSVVESFGSAESVNGATQVYTWSEKLQGFTRMSPRSD